MAKRVAKADNAVMKNKEDDSKLFAFLAVLLSIVGFIIAYVAKKDDKYVMFYAKQSLVLFIAWIIVGVLSIILRFIPIIGWIIYFVAYALIVAAWVIGWIYALSGKEKEIPVIGKYARKFNF